MENEKLSSGITLKNYMQQNCSACKATQRETQRRKKKQRQLIILNTVAIIIALLAVVVGTVRLMK